MSTATLTTSEHGLRAGDQPIDGYTLEQPIGQGGFGEVWRANAPGDLKKAVKFVFGRHDGSRATRERRSLERIRSIRHPFLLTLERFEIGGDRLIIVTELADGSMEDIYKTHRKSGSCGIPREVLLKNLHDTADGLDYLHQNFGLQHLDIKPANLLMVGGHVKVADFGLLKDLSDNDCSVVGGLTPIYAPPELFDGRPSLHSDQYSLAVLYQEMLTGTRPFSGRTIAQLATQHVHSTPNLEPLSPRDRTVVARALEKNPDRRFESCKEFIAELQSPSAKLRLASSSKPAVVPRPEVVDLPTIEDDQDETNKQAKRIFVVALGGTGVQCVQTLLQTAKDNARRTRIEAVMIDTDMASMPTVVVGPEDADRVKVTKLYTPLRSASEYRSSVSTRLGSISRRWIYNVPRDGSTQSMRPVGRLALVDHGPDVSDAMRQSIESIRRETSAEDIHVYVVGSLSGGTGGGMYIDVVHQLRHLLDDNGCENTAIVSLMSTYPLNTDDTSTLMLHSTLATLIETQHFLRPENGYPGDAGAGFESVPAARTPLRNLYIIPGLSSSRFGCRPIDTINRYIWNDTLHAGTMLQRSRQEDQTGSRKVTRSSIRTVGVVSVGSASEQQEGRITASVAIELLTGWLGTPAGATAKSDHLARRIGRRTGLSLQSVMAQIVRAVSSPTDPDHVDKDRLALAPTDGAVDFIAANISNQLQRELSIALGDRQNDLSKLMAAVKRLQDQASKFVQTQTEQMDQGKFDATNPWIRYREDLCRIAQHVSDEIVSECEFIIERLECLAAIVAVSAVQIKQDMVGPDPWSRMPKEVLDKRSDFLQRVHRETVNEFLVRPLNDPNSNFDSDTLISHLRATVTEAIAGFLQGFENPFGPDPRVSVGFGVHEDRHVSEVDSTATIIPSSDGSRQTIEQHLKQPVEIHTIEDAIAVVRPSLMDFGGGQRLILIVASAAQRMELEPIVREHYQGPISVAVRPNTPPTLIHEGHHIPLQSLITRLEVIGGDSQITNRLASRIDVDWSRRGGTD